MAEHRLDWKEGTLWLGDVNLQAKGECDACRELLKRGLAVPEDRFVTYRLSLPCMKGQIGWMADREVTSDMAGRLVLRKVRASRAVKQGVGGGRIPGTPKNPAGEAQTISDET